MKTKNMINICISIAAGTVTSIISTALLWYTLAFFAQDSGSSDFMPFLSLEITPNLAFFLGKIVGAAFGFFLSVIVVIFKSELPTGAIIGGAIGAVIFLLLLSAGAAKSDIIILSSLIPVGVIVGLTTSFVNNWLNGFSSLK